MGLTFRSESHRLRTIPKASSFPKSRRREQGDTADGKGGDCLFLVFAVASDAGQRGGGQDEAKHPQMEVRATPKRVGQDG